MPRSDPGYYRYLPIGDRPPLEWPDGARVALWIAPNLEFYELHPPLHPRRPPWPRPYPDVQGYSLRDYGNRVGIWRVFELLDRHDVRGSVALNVALCQHHPEVIEGCRSRGWEFFAHGVYNTRYLDGLDEAQERSVIEDCLATVERYTGTRLAGWLSPALTTSERTIDLLAEYGFKYTADLFHDDQPFPLDVRRGRLISLPYALETNDGTAYGRRLVTPRQHAEVLIAQFDQLHAEGGRVMCIPLHPFLSGHPHRLAALERALVHMKAVPGVWWATGAEIADWYYARCYDRVVAHLAGRRADRPGT
jgi:allantoinase